MTGAGAHLTRRTLLGAGFAAAAGIVLTGCAGHSTPRELRMACGEPGGTYIRFGRQLGAVYARRGTRLRALTTGGSTENTHLIAQGDADLGIALADAAIEHGAGLLAIGRVYQNYLQCIVSRTGPLPSQPVPASLTGARISIGAPGSGTSLSARRVLAALGLGTNAHPVELLELHLADAVTALAAGTIDAVIWSGGLPVPELERIRDTHPVTLLDLQAAVPELAKRHGSVYQPASVPAAVYESADPLPAIGVSNLLLVRTDFPERDARTLVDLLIDDAELLIPSPSYGVHFLSPPTLVGTTPIPLHPAAQARYVERYG